MNDKSKKSGIHAIESKRGEELVNQTDRHIGMKLERIFSPPEKMKDLDLADIIDVQEIQSLLDDFYKLAHIPIGIIDLKGNVLVGIGWQDICTRFHRAHPETLKHCIESDIKLSAGVFQGEFKLYRCKNNMWDIATPIMVEGQHVGNILLGQFFFKNEPLDYELFRSQAGQYGFNEEEYITALEKVPQLSRDTVSTIMVFFMKFANIVSKLGYSNIKLAQSLEERDALVEELRKSDERFRSVLENSLDSAYRMDFQNNRFDYMSPVIEQITGFSAREIDEMTSNDLLGRIHPDDRSLVNAGIVRSLDEGFGAHEYRFKCKDGEYRWLADHFSVIKDKTGTTLFRAGIVRDITKKKQDEETLIRSENEFRTLAENSPDVIARFDRHKRYAYINPAASASGYSPEEIIGRTSGELGVDPGIVKLWEEHIENVFTTGKPEEIEFDYKSPQGKEYYFNTRIIPEFIDGKVVTALAISRDITDTKKQKLN